ncbi:MAG: SMC-Scp complex subunit ScpB [Candidatus Liptonbacteria bacterium]|nr:SMC-Scp complex subunit ScpB [Candidatus Liptonbacteria bacterium]
MDIERSTDQKLARLEALLFIHGEPITDEKIAEALEVRAEEVTALVGALAERLEDSARGLSLMHLKGRVQLVTKPDFGEMLARFIKEEMSRDLTPASLETLSIVAYLGPIARSRIEYLRGVNSSFTLRNLLMRGLLERAADSSEGDSVLYEPSAELLKHLGVAKKEELPEYERYQSLRKVFETSPEHTT